MRVTNRLVATGAALAAVAGLAGWLALRPAPAPAPVADGIAASAPEAPEAVEGDEAGVTDEQAAALDAAPPVIETHEDGTEGAEIDESLADEAVPDADALHEGDEVPLTAPAADIDLPPGDPLTLPSGRQVWWLDSAQDTQGVAGLTYRFRFVYPNLTPAMDEATQQAVHQDMEALCNGFAVPRLGRPGASLPEQIVITLMQRPLTFGESDSSITQFFEAFSLAAPDGMERRDPATPLTCTWEVY